MKQNKFRVFNKANKKYITRQSVFMGDDGELYSSHFWAPIDSKNLIVEWYTDFKDSTNKEIYEGDILAIGANKHLMGVVVYDDGMFCVKWLPEVARIRKEEYSDRMPTNLKVDGNPWFIVGNINEHPELIQGDKL